MWGYVDLLVTFGRDEIAKTVKVSFLVVDCASLYQCIVGRPTLAELIAVPSTVHLKMKYYTAKGHVATLHGDIEAARRCFEAASKGLSLVGSVPDKSKKPPAPPQQPPPQISSVDLDNRSSKKDRHEEKKERKEKKQLKEGEDINSTLKDVPRPIPDGEFELVPLGEDPSRSVKIGKDLPDLAREQLKACLRENADCLHGARSRCLVWTPRPRATSST
jgi:hypothetical protein